MSSAVSKEKTKILETILSSPGIHEKCKMVLQVSWQHIILLGRLIVAGLPSGKTKLNDELIYYYQKMPLKEIKALH